MNESHIGVPSPPGAQAGGLSSQRIKAVTEGYLENDFVIFDPGNLILDSGV
jgi:hypothetical protein